MLVRWNYKLQPNKGQSALMDEWLVTLRKHRNYCLAERKRGFETNNQDADEPIMYQWGSYCELDTRFVVGAYSPLTCPVLKHGVLSAELTKRGGTAWGSVSDIQSKRTTELRAESEWYSRVNSDVLQGNLAKLDTAYSGFFKHQRGFPAFRKASNFKTFQYKPGRYNFEINRSSNMRKCYSHIYLPGIGRMRYLDSRAIPENADTRTVTVIKKADGWYISVLLKIEDELPVLDIADDIESGIGIDMGINQLIALSDGSFVENPRFATNNRTRRRLRIRQRRVNRKIKGSNNRRKAGIEVAKLHKKIADKREDYQWKAAHKVVRTADVIVREDLNIKGMKSRCKPKLVKGAWRGTRPARFMQKVSGVSNPQHTFAPNGQSAKRGLNRSISDASWGSQFEKIEWVAAKAGKPVIIVNRQFTSQECSNCGHTSKANRDGEKFVCESCGHIDHADTQASRTILRRANIKFVSKDIKILGADCPEVTAVRYDAAQLGEQHQGSNGISKAMPEKPISAVQLSFQFH